MKPLFLALMLSATPGWAQEDAPQPRCWLGSMGYSPGATMKSGDVVKVCGTDFTWQPTGELSSGCVAEGEFYSTAAIDNGPNAQAVKSVCQADGTWKRLE